MPDATIETEPSLSRRIIDLEPSATDVLLGLVAGHFATRGALHRETLALFVDEAVAVSS